MPPTLGFPLAYLVGMAFVFGAIVGSFLNVVIARVPFRQSVVYPGSHCGSCGSPVRPLHNIPILSWFWLRGRCATCKAPFSIRYALVELAFGLVCAFAVWRHGLTLPAAREVLMMGFLIPLALMDLDWWILPHELTWPGIAVGLLLSLAEGTQVFLMHLLAAAVAFTGLLTVGFIAERVLKREAMGQGDNWLFALLGAFLGLKALLPVILLSSVQGVLVGIPMLLLRKRREAKEPPKVEEPAKQAEGEEEEWQPDPTAVPFGPFLSLAGAELLYFTGLADLLFPL